MTYPTSNPVHKRGCHPATAWDATVKTARTRTLLVPSARYPFSQSEYAGAVPSWLPDRGGRPPGPSGEASTPAGTRGDIAVTIRAVPVQVASRGGTPGEPWGPPGRRRSVGRAMSRCAGDRGRECRVIIGH